MNEPTQSIGRGLRIACVIGGMKAGGAERVMALLCNHLAARGHEVTLVTLSPPDEGSFYELSEAIRLRPLGRDIQGGGLGRAGRAAGWIARLRRTLRGLRPDVVISFIDLANVMTLLATLGTRIPVIVSERIDPRQYRNRLSAIDRWLCRLTYPCASRIVVQTSRAARFFDRLPEEKLVTIPNPVPAAALMAQPDRPAADGRFRIVAVGRLDHQKGFDLLIDAFAKLAARFPQWDVTIFGQGAERATLLTQIERHGLGERVRLVGITKDIGAEYAGAHLMVLPSRYEGFPNALSEAMAAGLPAVAFEDVSGVEELIGDGRTGLLARWGSAPQDAVLSLADALGRLMASAHLRARLGTAARARVEEFRPERVFARWDTLIAEVRERAAAR